MPTPSFDGRVVLTFESRRAKEMAALVNTYGGRSVGAPALREVPLESNTAALDFAAALVRDELDVVVLLTGVGTRALVKAVEATYAREDVAAALARTKVVARGPKPVAALRELGVVPWVVASEPNTWHEVLAALDAKAEERPLAGARVAVQEYGVPNPELLEGLETRGAIVTRVPVYRWALPEDIEPLEHAVEAIVKREIDVVIVTTGVQLQHLWQVAERLGRAAELRQALSQTVIASIGPTTSEELMRVGLSADLEASHPKMGLLVREAAELSAKLISAKRPKT